MRSSISRHVFTNRQAFLLVCCLLFATFLATSSTTPSHQANASILAAPSPTAKTRAALPTATIAPPPVAEDGHYSNPDLGISLDYPNSWIAQPGEEETTLTYLVSPSDDPVVAVIFYSPMPTDSTTEDVAKQLRDEIVAEDTGVDNISDRAMKVKSGQEGWMSEFSSENPDGGPRHFVMLSAPFGGRLFSVVTFGSKSQIDDNRKAIRDMMSSVTLSSSGLYGIPRDQAFVLAGGESNNPRAYDPATGGGNNLIFSGLVMLNRKLEVVPDLAESWEISPDGIIYTFHLRKDARFHNGRQVTAQDVIYSWERAADPKLASDSVLTYLGDIRGINERNAGESEHISGLKAINDQTLQVTIDASKPYFLMKLTYGTSSIVNRENVESGPEWYRTPVGTGPYKLIRWEPLKMQLYERNDDFYSRPPAIRFVIIELFKGQGIRLYENDEVDITGVSLFDVERVRDPGEPLRKELVEGVSMCTDKVSFDLAQPPFDDLKVREAFSLAIDRQRYLDVVQRGIGVPAHGLYPPALPGYKHGQKSPDFDPALAKQRLSESRYGSADKLPPIIFTAGGFGSDTGAALSALVDMWRTTLGVNIEIENIEPDNYLDEIYAGRHGQLFFSGWCADYPDPENFADALFHSKAQQNEGHYSNPTLDALLEKARIERDVTKRIDMYQQAEQIIIADVPAIFLNHDLAFTLVKPRIKGYVFSPIDIPIERYLSIQK
ncbi:MAG: peptide ABC transporter substrate-binding protein [Chloroflexia bacterium]